MSSFFSKSSRAKGAVSSTPSSPPSLYSYTAPRIGSVSVPPSTTSSLAPPSSSASRLAAPSVFSTPPCSPPASPQHLKSALVPFRSATSPHPASTASALTSPELSPPPEKYSQLHGVEILAQTFMGKKGAGAKKKGKVRRATPNARRFACTADEFAAHRPRQKPKPRLRPLLHLPLLLLHTRPLASTPWIGQSRRRASPTTPSATRPTSTRTRSTRSTTPKTTTMMCRMQKPTGRTTGKTSDE